MKFSNNPFNIRATKSQWLGLTGSDNGFCTFHSIPYSVRCFLYLVKKTYVRRFGKFYTLEQFIQTYCPVGDGINDPDAYLTFVINFMTGRNFLVSSSSQPCLFSLECLYAFASSICRMETNYVLKWSDFLYGYQLFKS